MGGSERKPHGQRRLWWWWLWEAPRVCVLLPDHQGRYPEKPLQLVSQPSWSWSWSQPLHNPAGPPLGSEHSRPSLLRSRGCSLCTACQRRGWLWGNRGAVLGLLMPVRRFSNSRHRAKKRKAPRGLV